MTENKPTEYTKVENAKARVIFIEFVLDQDSSDDMNIENDVMEHLRQWGTAGIREDFWVAESYDDASSICRKRCR